jgi:hypothetical protein
MSDRTVHALYSGMEIVRYDKAGKWFLEPTNKTLERQLVTVEGAANAAIWGWFKAVGEAQIFFGRHGGSTFDRLVREQLAERSDAFEMESSEGSEIVGELKARVTEFGGRERAAARAKGALCSAGCGGCSYVDG